MNLFFLLPLFIGFCSVLQAGLNRKFSTDWGLSWALMLNSIIVLILVGLLLLFGAFPGKFSVGSIRPIHLLPGLFGFVIILFIPVSISKIGALNSFLILVTSQIVVSGLWDKFVEGVDLSWTRLMGACLAIAGAWLATK